MSVLVYWKVCNPSHCFTVSFADRNAQWNLPSPCKFQWQADREQFQWCYSRNSFFTSLEVANFGPDIHMNVDGCYNIHNPRDQQSNTTCSQCVDQLSESSVCISLTRMLNQNFRILKSNFTLGVCPTGTYHTKSFNVGLLVVLVQSSGWFQSLQTFFRHIMTEDVLKIVGAAKYVHLSVCNHAEHMYVCMMPVGLSIYLSMHPFIYLSA